jgi:hypothetical protein
VASLGFWRKAAAASRALQMVEEDKLSGCDRFTGTGDGGEPLTDVSNVFSSFLFQNEI